MSNHLSYERASEIFDYNADTGLLTWRVRTANRIKVGDVAGCADRTGYLTVWADGKMYKAHRVAFLLMTGDWPTDQIDHINGKRSDNKWANLRAATNAENLRNTKRYSNNKTGFKGVCWHKPTGKWMASIGCNGIKHHLGYFSTAEDASAMYDGAAAILFGEWQRRNT